MLVNVGRLMARGATGIATPAWLLRDENGDAALFQAGPNQYWFDGQVYPDFSSWSAAVSSVSVTVDADGTRRDQSGARVQATANVLRIDHDKDGAQIGWLLEGQSNNCFRNSGSPATQTISDGFSNRTNIWMEGSGSIPVSGPEDATVTEGNPVYYDLSGNPTLTPSGEVTLVQVEQGSSNRIPSSYIPTTSGAVGRDADVFNIGPNGSSLPFAGFAADAGTIVIHGRTSPYFNTVDQAALQLDDGSGSNLVKFYCTSNGANLSLSVKASGADQAAMTFSGFSLGRDFAAAIAFDTDDFALSIDGDAEIADTSGSVPSLTTLRIGSNGDGDAWSGHVNLIAYFPRRVPALPSRRFFRSFPSRVHILGDSFASANFSSSMQTLLGTTVLTTDGVGGSTLAEQLTRWQATPAFHDQILILTDDTAPFTDSEADIATFMATYASIVASSSGKFLIMEPGMPLDGVSGSSSRIERDNKWAAIVAAYPDNTVPVTAAMQASGDGSDLDNAYIAADLWPASCLTDPGTGPEATVDAHPNAKGDGIYAQCAFDALQAKGWV